MSEELKDKLLECFEHFVIAKFGKDKWLESLQKATELEVRIGKCFKGVQDHDMLALMLAVGEIISLPPARLMGAFGQYWATTYAPAFYEPYFALAKSTHDSVLSEEDLSSDSEAPASAS